MRERRRNGPLPPRVTSGGSQSGPRRLPRRPSRCGNRVGEGRGRPHLLVRGRGGCRKHGVESSCVPGAPRRRRSATPLRGAGGPLLQAEAPALLPRGADRRPWGGGRRHGGPPAAIAHRPRGQTAPARGGEAERTADPDLRLGHGRNAPPRGGKAEGDLGRVQGILPRAAGPLGWRPLLPALPNPLWGGRGPPRMGEPQRAAPWRRRRRSGRAAPL
mmetsp:Transcript_16149/g.39789  ORF Transcript_16149/g.39789 Transcript_16149/m.39789 type:complete len:216 (+) Transcript_16149:3-650(+)